MALGLHVELDPLKSDEGPNAFVALIYGRNKSAEFRISGIRGVPFSLVILLIPCLATVSAPGCLCN